MDTNPRPRLRPGRSSVGLALAVTLLAASCGAPEETVTEAGTDQTTAEQVAPDPASDEPADSEPAESGGDEDEAAISHTFPALDTTNIATGETVNLAAQLAGGETPVLLWFFAPH